MRAGAAGVVFGLCGLFGLPGTAWATPPEVQQPEPTQPEPAPAPEAVAPEAVAPPIPTAEPVPAQPPEPQLPAYDQPLPSYDELPIAPEVPFDDASFDGVPVEVEDVDPPTGRGRLAVGSILFGGGVVLTSVSTALIIQDIDWAAWIPGAVIGASAAVLGAVFVATGDLRRRTHRDWASAHAHAPIPPRGDGLVAGGLTCLIAGSMGTIIGGVSIVAFQADDDPPYGQVLIPIGLVSVVTGVGLLAAGSVRRKQFDRWETANVVPSLSLLPGNRQSFGGISLGFAGRF
jgi:hypothetical protein